MKLTPFIGLVFLGASLRPAETATKLADFEGIEEPELRYIVASGKFVYDDYVNIKDVAPGTVRMTLRYRGGDWWDSDRDRQDTSRQRAEVKGIGAHQKTGETFEYATMWRTNPEFRPATRFCHVFQLKATDGDAGAPLVVLSILEGEGKAAVRYWSGDAKGFSDVREVPWRPGTWQTFRVRIKTSPGNDGEILVSVDGDEFKGVKNVPVFRPDATDYRPKWGLYRGIDKEQPMPMGDDWIEHKDVSARKLRRDPNMAALTNRGVKPLLQGKGNRRRWFSPLTLRIVTSSTHHRE